LIADNFQFGLVHGILNKISAMHEPPPLQINFENNNQLRRYASRNNKNLINIIPDLMNYFQFL